ncbi:MAG: T9SS type A sorting domain-containing protein [Saprospiraceae bacterium]
MFPVLQPQTTTRSAVRQKLLSGAMLLLAMFASISLVQGQFSLNRVIISEVTVDGEIEIFNPTDASVNIGDYWLCNFPAYSQVSTLTIESGSFQLSPGATTVISGFGGFDASDGELGLYSTNSFGSSTAITSYIEYGSTGHRRSSVAVAANIWTAGMSLTPPTAGASIQAQGTPPSTLSYVNIAPTVGTPDPSLLNVILPEGGAISLVSGAIDTVICIDGVPSPFAVLRDGNSTGTNRMFVITDDPGNILALPTNNGPFDLEAAGEGTCKIWWLAFEDGLENLATGNHLSDLVGSYDLSNAITVVRQAPDGGVVTLLDGATTYTGCAGEIVLDIVHTTTADALSYWYIITDTDNSILAFANAATTSSLDLSGAPAGTCRIWGWNYRGLGAPIVGDNISTLSDDPCEDVSEEYITVWRETPDGGTVTLLGGATDTVVTAGNALVNVAYTSTGGRLSYWYIITDDSDNILAFANAATTSTLDLSGAPVGTCRIWGWNYRGLPDPVAGESITTLNDDFCEAISDAYITVVREDPNGGNQDQTVALNEVGENGWIEIINNTDQTVDLTDYWVCNRPSYAVLSSLTIECGTLVLAPGEIVVVKAFDGLDVVDGELALYNTNSFADASAIVSYMEWGSTGNGRSALAVTAGLWTTGRVLSAPTSTQSLQRSVELVNGESEFVLADPTFCAINTGVSATQSFEELEGVSVFPNPTTDYLMVSIDGTARTETVIRLFNMNGQLIQTQTESSVRSETSLDLSALPSGTYTLQVVSGNAATTRRVMKQ